MLVTDHSPIASKAGNVKYDTVGRTGIGDGNVPLDGERWIGR
jgi:hypothetical protein